jgi:hypothetical protein
MTTQGPFDRLTPSIRPAQPFGSPQSAFINTAFIFFLLLLWLKVILNLEKNNK